MLAMRVIFEEAPDDPAWLNELMSQQGLLMLALIDNADAVEWTYPMEVDSEPVISGIRLTREDLYESLDITSEDFSLTPAVLDQLLQQTS